MPRHIDWNARPYLPTATLPELRRILGDVIEAVSQLDMARESGGVVSHEVIDRLRDYLAEPAYHPTERA